MGYYVSIDIAGVLIPAAREQDCLAAINALSDGGYDWVDAAPDPGGYPSLLHAFGAWRYRVYTTEAGDTALEGFDGDRWGDEEVLFGAIAPFVRAATDTGLPTITVSGSDCDTWRYLFRDGVIAEERGVIQWVPA